MKLKLWIHFCLIFSFALVNIVVLHAQDLEGIDDGFTHEELEALFRKGDRDAFAQAVRNPALPSEDNTGERFYRALAWYKDTLEHNGDGRFEIREWTESFESDVRSYTSLFSSSSSSLSLFLQHWKMLQKMKFLEGEILARGAGYYPYNPQVMSQIDFHEEWNAQNTIGGREDFTNRVLADSHNIPVLVKFGLTYCIHCLLLENLGAVPALAKRYEGSLKVYKFWWNPQDRAWNERNHLAREEGVQSSPYFILYIDGQQYWAGYAFPDEEGRGLEEVLDPLLE